MPRPPARAVLLMGVAGSGKTTIGRLLAAALGWRFVDADDFHPPANLAKMSAGVALDDADRAPWLAALRAHIDARLAEGTDLVVACSALKQAYRDALIADPRRVKLVYLCGTRELLRERLAARAGHFMKPAMLDGQLDALEPPADALAVDISIPPEKIIARIRDACGL